MTIFDLATSALVVDFLDEIAEVITRFSDKNIREAKELLVRYWEGAESIESEGLLTETPYYWAMCILHHPILGDDQPEWYLDKKYMPPPSWIVEKYYSKKEK